jgi:hypothetical protein
MLPSAEKLHGDANFVFQQDLAPVHSAKTMSKQKVWWGIICNSRGVWGYSRPENIWILSTPRTAIRAFSKEDFWIYNITLCCR